MLPLRHQFEHYAVATLVVLLAALFRYVINPWLPTEFPFLTFFLAVFYAAWRGGIGPGLYASALSTIVAGYFFIEPLHQVTWEPYHVVALGIFGAETVAVSYLTERSRQMELMVQRDLRALEVAFETAPIGMCQVDREGRYVRINRRLVEMNGLPAEAHIGRTFREIVPSVADIFEPVLERVLRTGQPVIDMVASGESQAHPGVTRTFMESWYPQVNDQGDVVGVNVVVQDITHLKEVEEALRRSEEELRTMAAGLEQLVEERTEELLQSQSRLRALARELNLAEQRERKRLAAELHDHLQQALVLGKLKTAQAKRLGKPIPGCAEAIEQIDEVFTDALTYTRTLVAELSPPVLRDHGLLAGLQWLAEYMKKHELAVTIAAPEKLDARIPEDQVVLLFQSVRELLINSAKHSESWRATVTVEQRPGELHIEVADQGKGFNPGPRLAEADSSKFGLFSIAERMKAAGGSFTIESSPGTGTKARLIVPIEASARTAEAAAPAGGKPAVHAVPPVSEGNGSSARLLRILLVDDHAMVRQGLRSLLEGYPDLALVGESGDGEDAIRQVDALRPDVVIMDVNMPIMGGIEATSVIKDLYPDVCVVGLSVNADHHTQEEMKRAGAALVITKDAVVDELHAAIHKAMARSPLHED